MKHEPDVAAAMLIAAAKASESPDTAHDIVGWACDGMDVDSLRVVLELLWRFLPDLYRVFELSKRDRDARVLRDFEEIVARLADAREALPVTSRPVRMVGPVLSAIRTGGVPAVQSAVTDLSRVELVELIAVFAGLSIGVDPGCETA
ncbi:hypothetical protein [Mycolicibacterium palauense]|uniref:hypothetical protein n=1 Tax=Mycolicibacterium palauense TaxID=2034511 RepID=UPI000BFED0AB|nr:hypothetical protein [Mycolicibacterium palauense]